MKKPNVVTGDCLISRELDDLVTDLKSTLITKRLKAVKALGRLKTPLAVDPLAETLQDRSKEVRSAAIEALATIRHVGFHHMLVPLARDRSVDVRLRVAHCLGDCEEEEAIACLFDLLRDAKEPVALMAAKSLAKVPKQSLMPLIRLFSDRSWKIRSRAATAVKRMGKEAASALEAALSESDSNVRFWAASCLGNLRERAHSKTLLTCLHDPDTGVRIAALRALREIGDPNVAGHLFDALSQPSELVRDLIYDILKDFGTHSIPYLMDSLSSEFWMGRSLAARALSEMGSEAILPLTAALEGQDKERRFWAIKILGQLQEQSAFPEIKRLLTDEDSEIRMAAVQALGSFRRADAVPLLIERFLDPSWVVRREACHAIYGFGPAVVPQLRHALSSLEEDVRYWALRALGRLKPSGIFPEFVKMLKDRSWTIRKTASDVLGSYGEEALIELTNLATESDAEVRFWVLQALGKIGSSLSLSLLFRALEDPSEAIRNAAQKALANYGEAIFDNLFTLLKSDKRRLLESVVATFQFMSRDLVVPRLVQALGKHDDHVHYWIRRGLEGFYEDTRRAVRPLLDSKGDEIRRQAVLMLGQLGHQLDAELIIPHLKDEYWPTRIAAAEVLGALGDPGAVPPLLDALDDDDEELALAAIHSLGILRDDRAVPGLIMSLQRESWTLKFHAIAILGQLNVGRAVPDLVKMMDEEALDLKIPVIKALGQITHPDNYKTLATKFRQEDDSEARVTFIEAFGRLRDPAAVPQLIELAQPKSPWSERRAALRALAEIRDQRAKDVLMIALKDPDQTVSREGLAALRQILPPEEFQATETALTRARRRHEKFQAHFQEGLRHLRSGALAAAENELKNAARINPKAAVVFSALGSLYYKTGKLIDATKAYQAAVAAEPRDITLKMNLGMVYFRRRAYNDATNVFVTILKAVDPKSQPGLYAARMLQKIEAEQTRSSLEHK